MSLLEKNEVNTGRQIEADIAKTICIIGMVFVHCFEIINYFTVEVSAAEYIVDTVLDCIFGAATFMFCMGFGIAYSRSNAPEKLIRRGGTLLFYGYLLNFLREGIPYLLLYAISNDQYFIDDLPAALLNLDILHFAGLALMLFGLLKKLRIPDIGIAAVAIGLSIIGSFIRTFDVGSFLGNQLVGLFLGTISFDYGETLACFPLFNWFIFVVAGYYFALLMRRCSDKKKFYSRISPAASVVVIAYMFIAIPNRLGMMSGDFNKYYHLSTPAALICICASVAVLGMYYALSCILPEAVCKLATNISRNINQIYCIHWVILCWVWFFVSFFLQLEGLPDGMIFCAGTVLFIVSVISANIYVRFKKKRAEKKAAAVE